MAQELEASGEAAESKADTTAGQGEQPAPGRSGIAPLPTQLSATGPGEAKRAKPRQKMEAPDKVAGTEPNRSAPDESQTELKTASTAPLSTTPQAAAAKDREPVNLEQAPTAKAPAKSETKSGQPANKQHQTTPQTADPTPSAAKAPPPESKTSRPVNLGQALKLSSEKGAKSAAPADHSSRPANLEQTLQSPGKTSAKPGDVVSPPAKAPAAGSQKEPQPKPAQTPKSPTRTAETRPGEQSDKESRIASKATGPVVPVSKTPATTAKENQPAKLGQQLKAPDKAEAEPVVAPPQTADDDKATQSTPAQSAAPVSRSQATGDSQAERSRHLGQQLSVSSPPNQPDPPQQGSDDLAAQSTPVQSEPSAPTQPAGREAAPQASPQSQPAPPQPPGPGAAEQPTTARPINDADSASSEVDRLANGGSQAERQRAPDQQLSASDTPPPERSETLPTAGLPTSPQAAGKLPTASSPPDQPAQPASSGIAPSPAKKDVIDSEPQSERQANLGQQLKSSTPASQPVPAQPTGADVTAPSPSSPAKQPASPPSDTAPQSPSPSPPDRSTSPKPVDKSATVQSPAPTPPPSQPDPPQPEDAGVVTPAPQVQSASSAASPPPTTNSVASPEHPSERATNLGQQLKSSTPASHPVPAQPTGADVTAKPASPPAKQSAPLHSASTPQSPAPTPPPNRSAPTHSTNDGVAPQSTSMQPADRGTPASLPISNKATDEGQVENSGNLGQQLRSSSPPPPASELPPPAPQPTQPVSIDQAGDRAATQAPPSDFPRPAPPINDSPASQSTPMQPTNPDASTPSVLNSTAETERQEAHLGQELNVVAPPSQPPSTQQVSGAAPPSGQISPAQPVSHDAAPQPTPVQPTSHSTPTAPALNSERQAEEARTVDPQLSASASSPNQTPPPTPPANQPTPAQPASRKSPTASALNSERQAEEARNFGQQLKSPAPSSQPAATQPVRGEATTQSPASPSNRPMPEQPASNSAANQPTSVQSASRDTATSPPIHNERQTEEPPTPGRQLRSSTPSSQPGATQPMSGGAATQVPAPASSPNRPIPEQPTSHSAAPQPPPVQTPSHITSTPPTPNNERQTEGQPNPDRQLKSSTSVPQTGGKIRKESR